MSIGLAGRVKVSLVAARGRNHVIGVDGALPWRLSADLKRFKETTAGKPVLMGRATWESLPRKPLPGRANLVLTRRIDYAAPSAWCYSALETALAAARAMAAADGVQEVCVIGGEGLYRDTLDLADRLYLTDVDAAPDGDAVFPAVDEAAWRETARETRPADDKNDHDVVWRILDRAL